VQISGDVSHSTEKDQYGDHAHEFGPVFHLLYYTTVDKSLGKLGITHSDGSRRIGSCSCATRPVNWERHDVNWTFEPRITSIRGRFGTPIALHN
jgi:hypothetical protein